MNSRTPYGDNGGGVRSSIELPQQTFNYQNIQFPDVVNNDRRARVNQSYDFSASSKASSTVLPGQGLQPGGVIQFDNHRGSVQRGDYNTLNNRDN